MKVLMNLLTSVLFPDTPDVIIEEVTIEDNVLIFTLQSTRFCGECPVGGFASTRVHGSYVRKPANLPDVRCSFTPPCSPFLVPKYPV